MGGGYKDAPWVFKGRALYQLSLVKVEDAKKFVPSDLKLVQAFGYTLGGFYLARYEDSPAGKFDELVTLAGLVWNPPTSCAWAGRVYVSSDEARNHGIAACGLPSRLARFAPMRKLGKGGKPVAKAGAGDAPAGLGWWAQDGDAPPHHGRVAVFNADATANASIPACTIHLPEARPEARWAGPPINMALPSFSGRTEKVPKLLKYAVDLRARVRLVGSSPVVSWGGGEAGDESRALRAVMTGRPLLSIGFDDMEMHVATPEVVGGEEGEAGGEAAGKGGKQPARGGGKSRGAEPKWAAIRIPKVPKVQWAN